jgi:hypothetical protein
VQALADALTGAGSDAGSEAGLGDDGEVTSPLELIWDLTALAVATGEGLLRFVAAVTVDDHPDGTVASLDVATAMLVSVGDRNVTCRPASRPRQRPLPVTIIRFNTRE